MNLATSSGGGRAFVFWPEGAFPPGHAHIRRGRERRGGAGKNKTKQWMGVNGLELIRSHFSDAALILSPQAHTQKVQQQKPAGRNMIHYRI